MGGAGSGKRVTCEARSFNSSRAHPSGAKENVRILCHGRTTDFLEPVDRSAGT
jgi:hypothetical protein